MKSGFKRVLICALAVCLAFSVISCGTADSSDTPGVPPDYSGYDHQYEFYAYGAPSDGMWVNVDGRTLSAGEDFRTAERYREYMDAGMTMLYLSYSYSGYKGEDWATSAAKKSMDIAHEAGVERIILQDDRLFVLSGTSVSGTENGGLVGEGLRFATESELDAYVAELIAPYKDHPALYGVVLRDEPHWSCLKSVGQVYKALKRLMPEIYVKVNLYPLAFNRKDFIYPHSPDPVIQYEKYVKAYLEFSGADYIMSDSYPMLPEGVNETGLLRIQVFGKIARDYGIKIGFVTQACSYQIAGANKARKMEEADCNYVTNLLTSHGMSTVAFYTYWNHPVTYSSNGNINEYYNDGASFITYRGEKTDIYYNFQKIMAQMQNFAPTVLNFTYNAEQVFEVKPTVYDSSHIFHLKNDGEFAKVTNVSLNKEIALVTEMKDKENDRYMYAVQNIVDPRFFGSSTFETITVQFSNDCKYAVIYENGEGTPVVLDKDNSVTVKLHPGDARFILPY